MSEAGQGYPQVTRIQRGSLIVGVIGLALCVLGALISGSQFFQSYLWAYLFWLGIALGSFAIMLLQYLAGGRWGAVSRRVLEACALTLPLLAILFLPLLLGLPDLYVWARPDAVSADPVLQHKQPYLNIVFFLIRAVIYFVAWIGLTLLLTRWSREQDRTGNPAIADRLRRASAGGLIVYMLTVTFASLDWTMSLEPHWSSTIYGALIAMGQVLTSFAFLIAVLFMLGEREPLAGVLKPGYFNDLGNLMLAFVMLWAYMSFMQFLIIWSGNLPEEVVWYTRRLHGGWQWVPVILIVFHFAAPFLLLLSRQNKRRAQRLAAIAVFILVIHLVNLFWLVEPVFHQPTITIHWLDVVAPIGIGGIWIAFFLWQLQRRPLLPLHDPRLQEASAHE